MTVVTHELVTAWILDTDPYWESVEAMSRFAGVDPRRIHHLERDAEFLIELPNGVQVLEIVSASGQMGGEKT